MFCKHNKIIIFFTVKQKERGAMGRREFLAAGASLLAGIQTLTCLTAGDVTAVTANSANPFFAEKIEVEPGGRLMLRPRVSYIEELRGGGYNLVLNMPAGLRLSPLRVGIMDSKDRIDSADESVKELAADGQTRLELSYGVDTSLAAESLELAFCFLDKTVISHASSATKYAPVIKFSGTFDWTTFRKDTRIPEDNTGVIPLLLKWETHPTQSGTLHIRDFRIIEADSGKTVLTFHPREPLTVKIGKERVAERLIPPGAGSKIILTPGARHTIVCEAKGEDIKGFPFSETVKTKVSYTRTFVFDAAPDISLPDKLLWRLEGADGKVYKRGEVPLLAAKKTAAPQTLEISSWICETPLQSYPPSLQRLYLEKLRSWGMNTVEPEIVLPAYGDPLNAGALSIPIAAGAGNLGLRVKTYMRFLYEGKDAEKYLRDNPQFAAVDPRGRKMTRAQFVCPTHCLEPGCPWLKYYLDAIRKSVETNKLAGVFFDYEINAAPYGKCLPCDVSVPAGAPRRWYSPCMCERCRKAFQSGLGLDHTPNVEECCGDALYEKWVDFRCRQNIELWRLVGRAAKEGSPKATFAIYSGPPRGYTRQAYGVDWTMTAPFIDFAMLRDFCPFPKNEALELEAALVRGAQWKTPPPRKLFQLMLFPYLGDFWVGGGNEAALYAGLPNIKNDILRAVAECGSFGWSFTGLWGIDDQLTLPVKEANALLAKYEDFFVSGWKADFLVWETATPQPGVAVSTWTRGDGGLVTFVFNNTAAEKKTALEKKGGEKALVRIPPRDTVAHEWGR
jgi:hypothetical protein